MLAADEDGIVTPRCAECGGRWFGRNELTAYLNRRGVEFRWGWGERLSSPPPLPCPTCHAATLYLFQATEVTLARCAGCGGTFATGRQLRAMETRYERWLMEDERRDTWLRPLMWLVTAAVAAAFTFLLRSGR